MSDDIVRSERKLTEINVELDRRNRDRKGKFARFTLAALSSIPWVGGFIGAAASLHGEFDQDNVDDLQRQWLQLHEERLASLGATLADIIRRLEEVGAVADDRIEDPGYQALVQQGFRIWDQAITEEKRDLVKNVLVNAGGTTLCSDDVVRLFLDWIEAYHEAHFAVIREIHNDRGITRGEIWQRIYGAPARENSAEADLFKYLMRELSTGGVIRQIKATDADGHFLRQRQRRKSVGPYMKSAFDTDEPYELTELGRQFVHYAMSEVVPRLGGTEGGET
jgi:hypothetical protein